MSYLDTIGTWGKVTCEPDRGSLTAGSWLVIALYIVLGSFLLLGSVLDYVLPDKGVDGEYRRKGKILLDFQNHLLQQNGEQNFG